jgi:hypothetical protein
MEESESVTWSALREIGYTTPQPENGRLFTV